MEISLEVLTGVFFFIFGTLIGSFLNVVILRHNTGKDLSGRSRCQSCGRTLSPLELVPILSFLYQKGACRVCKSKISIQYPIVEFLTGVLFVLIFFAYNSIPGTVFSLVVISLLIIIATYDFRHRIVPNTFVYGFIGASIFSLFFDVNSLSYTKPSLEALLAGPILALPIWFLWQISNGKWIGLGDAKLFLGVGWFLGISAGVTAFVLSFWIGASVSLFLIFLGRVVSIRKLNLGVKDLTIKNEIPFAPFIILSFFIVYLLEFNLISFIAP
ncbi:prepilin peptidase [Candidatus Kaiserbacteria bacterium]|nr:prepilin peptidase [Candidatus Kaiserbacteria bacterium]